MHEPIPFHPSYYSTAMPYLIPYFYFYCFLQSICSPQPLSWEAQPSNGELLGGVSDGKGTEPHQVCYTSPTAEVAFPENDWHRADSSPSVSVFTPLNPPVWSLCGIRLCHFFSLLRSFCGTVQEIPTKPLWSWSVTSVKPGKSEG